MKQVIIGLLASLSLSAWACPNLAGSYQCQNEDGAMETMTIEQRQDNGVTVYNIDGDDYVADNQVRQSESMEDGVLFRESRQVRCEGSEVVTHEVVDVLYEGTLVAHVNVNVRAGLSSSGDFYGKATGYVESEGNKEIVDETAACKRLN